MIILAVRRRSWIVGASVVDSFEFCSIYFLSPNSRTEYPLWHLTLRLDITFCLETLEMNRKDRFSIQV